MSKNVTKLTEKQQLFVMNKIAGLSNRQAAIQAGFAPASAMVQAGKLMQHPKIIAALAGKMPPSDDELDETTKYGMRSNYSSSLELLQHTYNNPKMSMSARLQAAIQALPYEHAKIGEKGKKESRQEKAEKGTAEGRFKAGRPPKGRPQLRAVTGGK